MALELGGFIIGSVALTSLFNTCVDNFKYIQLGRNFGKDYETSLLRLDVIRLRFTRWGESVKDGGASLQYPPSINGEPIEDVVHRLLAKIYLTIQEAQKKSSEFRRTANSREVDLSTGSPRGSSAVLHEVLQRKMEERYRRTQNSTSLVKKVQWALYKKEHLDSLIQTIDQLVSGLISLFPATQRRHRELCEADLAGIERKNLQDLEALSRGSDELLGKYAKMKLDGGQSFRNVEAFDRAEGVMGNHPTGSGPWAGRQGHQEFQDISARGASRLVLGNTFEDNSAGRLFSRPK